MIATLLLVGIIFLSESVTSKPTSQNQHQNQQHQGTEETLFEDASSSSSSLSTRNQKIINLERQLNKVRETEVAPAMEEVMRQQHRVSEIKATTPWFPNQAQKDTLARAESDLHHARAALQRVENKALDLHDKLKPLYGILSREFYEERKEQFQATLGFVSDASYRTAWWDTLFSSRRHDSLTDMIVSFFLQWIISYLVMYPFAGVYFLGWGTPKAIYAYSSSWTDIFVGVGVWCISFVVFLIPPALILGALYLMIKGAARQAAAQERRGGGHGMTYEYVQYKRD
eukprot:PhF_6_TR29098/c0_g1_i1/m.42439